MCGCGRTSSRRSPRLGTRARGGRCSRRSRRSGTCRCARRRHGRSCRSGRRRSFRAPLTRFAGVPDAMPDAIAIARDAGLLDPKHSGSALAERSSVRSTRPRAAGASGGAAAARARGCFGGGAHGDGRGAGAHGGSDGRRAARRRARADERGRCPRAPDRVDGAPRCVDRAALGRDPGAAPRPLDTASRGAAVIDRTPGGK